MPAFDSAARRKGQRKTKRERGVWVYVPAEVLQDIGAPSTDTQPPWYAIWPRRDTVIVKFYDAP